MSFPKFAYFPQPVFSDQRDTERVFVITRRHIIDFLQSLAILSVLVILPIIIGAVFGSSIVLFMQSNPAYWGDLVILSLMIYFLMLIMFFMTSWIGFYYNLLIITDERIVEITQRGFFSRETYELTYDQIEDVDFTSRGLLATYFDAGDIEIQTAGPKRNFFIRKAPKPHIIGAIIHDLEIQAKNRVPIKDRMPSDEVIGLILSTPVHKSAKIPPIMNFLGGLDASRRKFMSGIKEPKTLRQKFDRWWWFMMKREQMGHLDFYNLQSNDQADGAEGEKSDGESVDL